MAPTRLYCGHGPVVGSAVPEVTEASESPITSVAAPPATSPAIAKIDEYIKHRLDREGQILTVFEVRAFLCVIELADTDAGTSLSDGIGFTDAPAWVYVLCLCLQKNRPSTLSARDIALKMYPQEGCPETLLAAASHSVLMHILKVRLLAVFSSYVSVPVIIVAAVG